METIRRLSALFIALSLALPQRSCMNGGQFEIHYPLSNVDSAATIIVIAALFTLPLLLVLPLPRFRLTSLVLGMAAACAGLYYVSYTAAVIGTNLLIGWYVYTVGAIAYLAASLALFVRALMVDLDKTP